MCIDGRSQWSIRASVSGALPHLSRGRTSLHSDQKLRSQSPFWRGIWIVSSSLSYMSLCGCLLSTCFISCICLPSSVVVWFHWNSVRPTALAWWSQSWTTTPWGQTTLKARPFCPSDQYRESLKNPKEMNSAYSQITFLLKSACLWCILSLTVRQYVKLTSQQQMPQGASYCKYLPMPEGLA